MSNEEEFDGDEHPIPRPALDGEMELEVFDAIRGGNNSPVTPIRLDLKDSFQFRCHSGVKCWNQCCHGADITLTPSDILRLSKHLGVKAMDFLREYTVPALWPKAELPVAKLKMGGDEGKGACPFVREAGCSVYGSRPMTCRYYPLGMISFKHKESEERERFHFLVKEEHCQGHKETKVQTVAEFRGEQNISIGEEIDQGWYDILMKMASWSGLDGPFGKELKPQTKQMFFMVTTDIDSLRRFVLSTKFMQVYEIASEAAEVLETDDEALLQLGLDWMKNVLFNEPTLSLKAEILQRAIAKAREEMGAG